jgi:hypothetical protein
MLSWRSMSSMRRAGLSVSLHSRWSATTSGSSFGSIFSRLGLSAEEKHTTSSGPEAGKHQLESTMESMDDTPAADFFDTEVAYRPLTRQHKQRNQPLRKTSDASSIAIDLDAEAANASDHRMHRLSQLAQRGAQSRLGQRHRDDAATPTGSSNHRKHHGSTPTGSAQSKRRSHLSGMSHAELAQEMFRYGRHATQAKHLAPVLEEIMRRATVIPHGVVKDACLLAYTAGLHQLAVSIFIARSKTHARDSHFALLESVVDSAYALGSPETIAQVCRAIELKMSFTGHREVPSELALYRALWRLALLQSRSALTESNEPCKKTRRPGSPPPATAAQCLEAARTVFNVLLSYDKDNVLTNCARHRHITLPLSERVERLAAEVETQRRQTDGKDDSRAAVNGSDSVAKSVTTGPHTITAMDAVDLVTPDEAFTHLLRRTQRICHYGADQGELAFVRMIHDHYTTEAKRRASPATRYPALFRACRGSGLGDVVHTYFLEYLQLLLKKSSQSSSEDNSLRVIDAVTSRGSDGASASAALGIEALLPDAIGSMEEIVLHAYFSALLHCRDFARVVSVAELLLDPSVVSDKYVPSPSVLALVLRAAGETQSAATAELALKHLLDPASGASPSPHEVFVSLMGLAKCGLNNFEPVLSTCIENQLLAGNLEERGYLLMQHALNTIDPLAASARVEAMFEAAKAPLSERIMVLVLQVHLRVESDAFLQRFKVFCGMKGGPAQALPSWIELLIQWAERRRYLISDEDRRFIVEDVLPAHGLDNPEDDRALSVLEISTRKQLHQLLNDHRERGGDGSSDATRGAKHVPASRDPRLFFLQHANRPVVYGVPAAETSAAHSLADEDVSESTSGLLDFDVVDVSTEARVTAMTVVARRLSPLGDADEASEQQGTQLGLPTLADRALVGPPLSSTAGVLPPAEAALLRMAALRTATESTLRLHVTPTSAFPVESGYVNGAAVWSSVGVKRRVLCRDLPTPSYETWGTVLSLDSDRFEQWLTEGPRAAHLAAGTTPAAQLELEGS